MVVISELITDHRMEKLILRKRQWLAQSYLRLPHS